MAKEEEETVKKKGLTTSPIGLAYAFRHWHTTERYAGSWSVPQNRSDHTITIDYWTNDDVQMCLGQI